LRPLYHCDAAHGACVFAGARPTWSVSRSPQIRLAVCNGGKVSTSRAIDPSVPPPHGGWCGVAQCNRGPSASASARTAWTSLRLRRSMPNFESRCGWQQDDRRMPRGAFPRGAEHRSMRRLSSRVCGRGRARLKKPAFAATSALAGAWYSTPGNPTSAASRRGEAVPSHPRR